MTMSEITGKEELVFTPETVEEKKAEHEPILFPIVNEHHPVLKEVIPEYDFTNHDYKTRKFFSDCMIHTMKSTGGIGLSACQVNQKVRMFVMMKDLDTGEVLICYNPKILEESNPIATREGCLSFPALTLQIKRPSSIKVQYFDEEENELVIELHGLAAKVFQHELDHLNGVVFTSKVSREILTWERQKQAKMVKKYKKFYNRNFA